MPAPVVLVTDEHGVVQDANRAAVAKSSNATAMSTQLYACVSAISTSVTTPVVP